jgi:hypothetical protein
VVAEPEREDRDHGGLDDDGYAHRHLPTSPIVAYAAVNSPSTAARVQVDSLQIESLAPGPMLRGTRYRRILRA